MKLASVNSHTLPKFTSVTFEMLDDRVEQLVVLGKEAFITKADLQDAFSIIRLTPRLHTVRFQVSGTEVF